MLVGGERALPQAPRPIRSTRAADGEKLTRSLNMQDILNPTQPESRSEPLMTTQYGSSLVMPPGPHPGRQADSSFSKASDQSTTAPDAGQRQPAPRAVSTPQAPSNLPQQPLPQDPSMLRAPRARNMASLTLPSLPTLIAGLADSAGSQCASPSTHQVFGGPTTFDAHPTKTSGESCARKAKALSLSRPGRQKKGPGMSQKTTPMPLNERRAHIAQNSRRSRQRRKEKEVAMSCEITKQQQTIVKQEQTIVKLEERLHSMTNDLLFLERSYKDFRRLAPSFYPADSDKDHGS